MGDNLLPSSKEPTNVVFNLDFISIIYLASLQRTHQLTPNINFIGIYIKLAFCVGLIAKYNPKWPVLNQRYDHNFNFVSIVYHKQNL